MTRPVLQAVGATLKTRGRSQYWVCYDGIETGDKVEIKEQNGPLVWKGEVQTVVPPNKGLAIVEPTGSKGKTDDPFLDVDVTVTNEDEETSDPMTDTVILDGP